MTHITKGANIPVPSELLRVAVCRQNVAGAPTVDASALLLDANGKVRGDADLVFYNQPHHPSGTVRHLGTDEGNGQLAEWLEADLPRLGPEVQRVVIAGSCDGGVFGSVPGLYVQVLTGGGAPVALYAVNDATTETAFVIGEFYRRGGGWKFRAVGQGYASGLAGLATDFGSAVLRYDGPPSLLGLRRTTSDDDPLSYRPGPRQDGDLRRHPGPAPAGHRPAVGDGGGPLLRPGHRVRGDRPAARPDDGRAPRVLDRAAGGRVSGQGYTVVRHTGSESGMMLTHEPKGALDLPVVWALGERLEPVRRITTAPGLHTFPTGFLQIRTGGAWSLEIR
ncbi:TerD family protein [Streptomyces sp. Wb2n-11]|uniref:TerD family protein n=1 Tax=Streptomyces sp. Wb2n-11 TaxID=1030533 RepID=UPI000B01F3D6|nr:TerD family protein [Streptomyces sp. Wb2n-11]